MPASSLPCQSISVMPCARNEPISDMHLSIEIRVFAI
jgi:hypothetical protein